MAIITSTQIRSRIDLPTSLEEERKLLKSIALAEEVDLHEFLGDDFYQDFKTNYIDQSTRPTTGVWFNLYEKLTIPMIYWSYLRLLPQQQINVTRFSVVQKDNEYSKVADEKQMTREMTRIRRLNAKYLRFAVDFIIENKGDYPNFDSCNIGSINGFRISSLNKQSKFKQKRNFYSFNRYK